MKVERGTHDIPLDEHLPHLPELLSIRRRLIYLAEGDVHEVVAFDEVAVERDAVLELHQLFGRTLEFQLRSR